MTLKDSADEMTFDLLEVPIVDKDIEGAVDNVTLDGNQYTDYLWLKKQFIQKWSLLCDDEYTRLRGFYTRQFENADVPSYRLYYGDDIARNSTLSGEYIQFSVEGVADGTMSLTQIDGNTTQDGTPTPSAPVPVQTVTGRQTVTVAGKNLLRNAYQATQTINLGKNLFDKENANVLDGYVSNSAIVATNNDYTIWIPCEPNATYTIQKMNATPQATTRFRMATTKDEPILGRGIIQSTYWNAGDGSATNVHTITTASNSHYLAINIMQKSATTTLAEMLASIQIEKGHTASSYSAYFEPIELCKIVGASTTWQDRIYKENGKWWLHKEIGKVVLNGSETWTWQPSGGYDRAGLTPTGAYIYTDTTRHTSSVLSSHFSPSATNGYGIVFQYQEKTWLYPQATITTLADFKTWLGTALPSVYYRLATPTTTEITNEEVLEGLEAIQDEAISVGQHNIYTDTPNALPTLTFDLTEYLSQSTTIIPETAVRLTLTDGGVINACGCRKDVQLTMRETIE